MSAIPAPAVLGGSCLAAIFSIVAVAAPYVTVPGFGDESENIGLFDDAVVDAAGETPGFIGTTRAFAVIALLGSILAAITIVVGFTQGKAQMAKIGMGATAVASLSSLIAFIAYKTNIDDLLGPAADADGVTTVGAGPIMLILNALLLAGLVPLVLLSLIPAIQESDTAVSQPRGAGKV